jgi:predicted glycoside hydrolase/deacetylase ChbG (UPF0249 family)
MKEKRLIVNADDFGMSRGISDGILLAHRFGFLTSASLMVNMPATDYAVERLATAPALSVGIHLNICRGRPISPGHDVPSLVDATGEFHSPPVMIRKLWRCQTSTQELETEFHAQIRWMKSRGLQPSHADSHHHMHIYPTAVSAFARAVAAEGIPSIRASRFSCWPRNGAPGGASRRMHHPAASGAGVPQCAAAYCFPEVQFGGQPHFISFCCQTGFHESWSALDHYL